MSRLWPCLALLALPAFGQQRPVQRTDPQYSEEALIAGLEGTVQLAGVLGTDGSVRDLKVVQPLGLGLDEQAIAAVAQWRYDPGASLPLIVPIEFNRPSKGSRWHLVGAKFEQAEGISRPVFVRASYPLGAGITPNAYEEGRLLSALGRPANVTVAFEIDDHGKPGGFEILKASYDIWGFEAANLVAGWQFSPGMKEGAPISTKCVLDFVWGPETLTPETLAQQLDVLHPTPRPNPTEAAPMSPTPLVQVQPVYTDQARAEGLEGAVRVRFQIAEDGTPRNIQLTDHLGLGLDEQAVKAVTQWRFLPGLLNAQPAAFSAEVVVNFHLDGVETSLSTANLLAPKAAPKK